MWDTLWGAEQLFVPHRATISTTRAVQLYGPEAAGGPVMHDTASCGLLHHRTTKGPEIEPQSLYMLCEDCVKFCEDIVKCLTDPDGFDIISIVRWLARPAWARRRTDGWS